MIEQETDTQEQEVVLSEAANSILALLYQWKRGLPIGKISPKLGLAAQEVEQELQNLERYQIVECDHGGPTDFHRPPSEQHRVQLWKLTPDGESLLSDGAITV